jgi:hypothetical protein
MTAAEGPGDVQHRPRPDPEAGPGIVEELLDTLSPRSARHPDDSLRKPFMCIKGSSRTMPTVDLEVRTSVSRAGAAIEGSARLTAPLLAAEGFRPIGPGLTVSGR